jgi:hypothetical protein
VISGEIDDMSAALGAAHPPSLPDAPTFETSYRDVSASLPSGLQDLARGLPHRLGLVSAPDGGWDEFINLHPNRDLPLYAAQGADGALAVPAARVARFSRAHHAGAFCWLVHDRLRDRQIAADARMQDLGGALAVCWRQALADANAGAGGGGMTDRLAAEVAARWQRGTTREQRVLAAGAIDVSTYAELVRDKLRWIGLPAYCLALLSGTPARARAFRHAHDLFLLALQAIDDVSDRDEDRTLGGADYPSALGCTAGALLRAAPMLAGRAAAVAAEAGFSWFAAWLAAFRRAIATFRLPGDAIADELGAVALAGQMEEALG